MVTIDFELRGEHIALDALLKATGLAPSGGTARMFITQGLVQVDGKTELRKTAKIRDGQCVDYSGTRVRVAAGPAQGDHPRSTGPAPA